MNPNTGNPSSTNPSLACFAALRNGSIEEPFACPVNLDEERDANVSKRPYTPTRSTVERRDDISRKQAPKYPLPSFSVPKKEDEEMSCPFAVDRYPAHRNVARIPKPSVHAAKGAPQSLSAQARNNQNVHQSALQDGVNGQNLDYFAEIARRKKYSASTSSTKPVSRPQIVNTPLGLAVLLNHSCSKPPTSSRRRLPVNTVQHQKTNKMQPCPTNTMQTNQQSQPNAVASNLTQLRADQTKKFQRWSPEEDTLLRIGVEKEGGPPHNWKAIASKYFSNSRSGLQCKSRWTKSLKPGIVRGAWSPEDDAIIFKYRQEGLRWSQIAEYLPGRLPEHIADRYSNFLDPTLKKSPWTHEEDRILFQEQRRLGNKWTQISHLIPGRSENSVKNRWHNLKVSRERKMCQRKSRNELRLGGDDIQRKRLLERKIRLLQSARANKSSLSNSDTNHVDKGPEPNRLEHQIQLLRLGPTQSPAAAPSCATKEVIEILDDDDDDH